MSCEQKFPLYDIHRRGVHDKCSEFCFMALSTWSYLRLAGGELPGRDLELAGQDGFGSRIDVRSLCIQVDTEAPL